MTGQDVLSLPLDYLNRKITEKEWQGLIRQTARAYGWDCYHTQFSFRSDIGYPDLHLWHAVMTGYQTSIWAECKTESGKLRPKQAVTIDSMRSAGLTVYVWRPSDWEQVVRVLSFGRARAA
jgi:hypothetical protein